MVFNRSEYYISPEEYLEREKLSEIKHEYIDGEVYAMAGASDTHVTISGNFYILVHSHLRGNACRVYMADMKVEVEKVNRYFYPDLLVTCDDRDREFEYFKKYPCLIVEVLSKSTEGYDRGKKFADYRKLDTLQEYVLVSPEEINVECFRRDEAGNWVLYSYEKDDEVHLTSIDFHCPIKALYEDVNLPDIRNS
ncbi:Uma2 family endonuclease [Cronbergia sp. UHCC 0137]|uniref:Uma2 family endonuclease n=1 Tax=Cronbergia sp. UHCC 0137 TaxID=3110239 RepID=UPI002B1ED124|nr:Uma2 family endonuclease [Cronbergia sp. UHCC 0137]MEA5617008.1 Uma2 family endonuclease [Cronbergia sp. UHCC 0137]